VTAVMINLKCIKRVLFGDKAAEKTLDKILSVISIVSGNQEEGFQSEWDSMKYEHPLYKICPGLADLVQLENDDSDEEEWEAHQTTVPEVSAGVKKFLHSIKMKDLQPISTTSPTTSSPSSKRIKANTKVKRSNMSLENVAVSLSPQSASKPPVAKRNKKSALSTCDARNKENEFNSTNARLGRPSRSTSKNVSYVEHSSDSENESNLGEVEDVIA